jgi:hypothetical protein
MEDSQFRDWQRKDVRYDPHCHACRHNRWVVEHNLNIFLCWGFASVFWLGCVSVGLGAARNDLGAIVLGSMFSLVFLGFSVLAHRDRLDMERHRVTLEQPS